MKVTVLTLFPEMFDALSHSIVGRAQKNGLVEICVRNLRDWSTDNYQTVDDKPFGGGAGMVMKVDVIDRALGEVRGETGDNSKVILLDAGGQEFVQKKAVEFAKIDHLIFVCGHYEGIDHRVHEHLVDEVISVGKYVMSGGELPSMCIIDSVVRLLPGALGNSESLEFESFNEGNEGEYPQYTRPREYKGWNVPEILLSGNHEDIRKWRKSKTKRD